MIDSLLHTMIDGACTECGLWEPMPYGAECPARLRERLDRATRDPSKPLAGIDFGAWERCGNGVIRYDVRGYGPGVSEAVMALGVGLDEHGMPIVTWEIGHPDTGVSLASGRAASVATAVARQIEAAMELGWAGEGEAPEPCPRCGAEPCDCGDEPVRDVFAEAEALGWWRDSNGVWSVIPGRPFSAVGRVKRLYATGDNGGWSAWNAEAGVWHGFATENEALAYALDHRGER